MRFLRSVAGVPIQGQRGTKTLERKYRLIIPGVQSTV
jgi:hypothetical protein